MTSALWRGFFWAMVIDIVRNTPAGIVKLFGRYCGATGLGVVGGEFALDDTDHDCFTHPEGSGGEYTFSLGLSALKLESVVHRALLSEDGFTRKLIFRRVRRQRAVFLDYGALILSPVSTLD